MAIDDAPNPSWSPPPPPPPARPPTDVLPVWSTAPAPPDERAAWRRVATIVVVGVVGLALIGGVLGATVFTRSSGPSHWDARLGDLPATVERLRGLSFTHPVPVRYLTDKEFVRENALGSAKPSAAARRAADRIAASFRALGLLTGKVDLLAAAKTSQANRVLAYYDPDRKEVVIRAGGTGPLDAPHRVVLAHELTHVLQDQHFDLNALRERVSRAPGQSADALRAVIEGDAIRIEDAYRTSLPGADRAAFDRWKQEGSQQADQATKDVPAVLSLTESAPYVFGPSAMQVVASDGGNAAVDRVFRHGVFTQKLFLDATESFTEPAPRPIAAPTLGSGEHALGKADELGAFDLYLLLASRSDPVAALDASMGWGGGRMRTVKDAGRVCERVNVTGSSTGATRRIGEQLQAWALALPAGMATVGRHGSMLTIRSCDPGATAPVTAPDAAFGHATNVLAAHNEIEASLVKQVASQGLPMQVIRCASLEFVRSPSFAALLALPDDQVTSEQVGAAIDAASPGVRTACGL